MNVTRTKPTWKCTGSPWEVIEIAVMIQVSGDGANQCVVSATHLAPKLISFRDGGAQHGQNTPFANIMDQK